MKERLKGLGRFLGFIAVMLIWFALTFAFVEACSYLQGPCDPDAYNHCDTPSGPGPGNR